MATNVQDRVDDRPVGTRALRLVASGGQIVAGEAAGGASARASSIGNTPARRVIVAGEEHRPLARLFARVALRVSGGRAPSQVGQLAGHGRDE